MGYAKKFVAATGIMLSLSSQAEPMEIQDLNHDQLNEAKNMLQQQIDPLINQLSDKFVFNNDDSSVKSLVGRATDSTVCFNESSGVARVDMGEGQVRERNLSKDFGRRETNLGGWFKQSLNLARLDDPEADRNDPETLLNGKRQLVQDLAQLKEGMEWMLKQDNLQFTGHWKQGQAPEGLAQHDVVIYPPDADTGKQTVYITNLMQRGGTYNYILDMVDTLKRSPDVVVSLDKGVEPNGFRSQVDSEVHEDVKVPQARVTSACVVP